MKQYLNQLKKKLFNNIKQNGHNIRYGGNNKETIVFVDIHQYYIDIYYDISRNTIKIYITNNRNTIFYYLISDFYTKISLEPNCYIFEISQFVANVDFITNFILSNIIIHCNYQNMIHRLDSNYKEARIKHNKIYENIEYELRNDKLKIIAEL